MDVMKKVSIIVPVYNTRPYLEDCLESIKNQTYTNLEVIVVDDGSTDGSGELCDKYAELDSRFIVHHVPNGGFSSARNIGLKCATGDYVGFVDSDDYVAPDLFDTLMSHAIEHQSDITMCSMAFCLVNGFQKKRIPPKTGFLTKKDFTEAVYSLKSWRSCRGAGGYVINKLFSKQVIKNLIFEENRSICEDELFSLQVAEGANAIFFVDQELYFYRQRQSGFSKESQFSLRLIAGREKVFNLIDDELKPVAGLGLLDVLINTFKKNEPFIDQRVIKSKIKSLNQYAYGLDGRRRFYCKLAHCPDAISNLYFAVSRKLKVRAKHEKYS